MDDLIEHIYNSFYPYALRPPVHRRFFTGGSFMYMSDYETYHWLHRTDGPACEYCDGRIGFYLFHKLYVDTMSYCDDAGMDGEQKLCWFLKYGDCLPTTMVEYEY